MWQYRKHTGIPLRFLLLVLCVYGMAGSVWGQIDLAQVAVSPSNVSDFTGSSYVYQSVAIGASGANVQGGSVFNSGYAGLQENGQSGSSYDVTVGDLGSGDSAVGLSLNTPELAPGTLMPTLDTSLVHDIATQVTSGSNAILNTYGIYHDQADSFAFEDADGTVINFSYEATDDYLAHICDQNWWLYQLLESTQYQKNVSDDGLQAVYSGPITDLMQLKSEEYGPGGMQFSIANPAPLPDLGLRTVQGAGGFDQATQGNNAYEFDMVVSTGGGATQTVSANFPDPANMGNWPGLFKNAAASLICAFCYWSFYVKAKSFYESI